MTLTFSLKLHLVEKEYVTMANYHEMRMGEIYVCEGYGLQLKVVKECKEVGTLPGQYKCAPCSFVCCVQESRKKQ